MAGVVGSNLSSHLEIFLCVFFRRFALVYKTFGALNVSPVCMLVACAVLDSQFVDNLQTKSLLLDYKKEMSHLSCMLRVSETKGRGYRWTASDRGKTQECLTLFCTETVQSLFGQSYDENNDADHSKLDIYAP